MAGPHSWTHHGVDATYMCSTDSTILDLQALNAALGSDMLWWATALSEDRLKTMVDNCLVFAVYHVQVASLFSIRPIDPVADSQKRTMIGAARLITDRVTFGYLTDVYMLKEHQQRGLGTFLMKCLNEVLDSWPDLRALWILSSSPESRKLYEKIFGTVDFFEENSDPNLRLLEKKGPRSNH
ncbi:hypothetical protein M406DRAFT_266713 [Cryphonectria parasitica EP155]|uniref:N-acetyltransferase domain-containing protein n=1 Tax=Cryphonectria parasitica (strain ATCC 38755 / EP155) TaxID=660469 RepID=A0A9P4XV36_CRYP1|nr:uncharacterized protein M406DRAFT_266713 [Cryphonectria parasitica EP155]KAF3761453.1 hypothetical protein M406DRAFT_266713 [Cryphonectria parasitica EP155]